MSHSASVVLAGTVLTSLAWGQQITQPVGITEPDASSLNWRELHGFNPVPPRRGLTGGLRSAPILYVDQSAPPGGDGSSWELAYRDLQQALADAQADPTVVEIRVAEGVYRTDGGTGDRTAEFLLIGQSNLSLLGGFPAGGGETEERDPAAHRTVLSGDLANDDIVTFEDLRFDSAMQPVNGATAGAHFENIGDNSRTVLGASGADQTVVVDGFTITGGHDVQAGGGLIAGYAGLRLRNLTFYGNAANSLGGAVYLVSATTQISMENCTFVHNDSGSEGGAVYLQLSAVRASGCVFRENSSGVGGAVSLPTGNPGQSEFEDCLFEGNVASSIGGGLSSSTTGPLHLTDVNFRANLSVSNGGGANISGTNVIVGCAFTDNISGNIGGGARIIGTSTLRQTEFTRNHCKTLGGGLNQTGTTVIEDCTFRLNYARQSGGGASIGSAVQVGNCLFEQNRAVIDGGGLLSSSGSGTSQVRFVRNLAGRSGGGVSTTAGSVFTDCDFVSNVAGSSGGGADLNRDTDLVKCTLRDNFSDGRGGGAVLDSSSDLRNCIISGNTASTNGGGVAMLGTNYMYDCIVAGNTAGQAGGGIWGPPTNSVIAGCTIVGNYGVEAGGIWCQLPFTLRDSILWDNTDDSSGTEAAQITGPFSNISYCIIMGLSDYYGNHNRAGNPAFMNASGSDGVIGTIDDDFRLRTGSPAIDGGSVAGTLDNLGPYDLAGNPRYAGFGGSTSRVVDMGALEAQDCDADGLADAESVAQLLVWDCNEDGVPDSCQIGYLLYADWRQVLTEPSEPSFVFGNVVDLDGDLLIVGDEDSNDPGTSAGAAYLFDARTGTQIAELVPSVLANGDKFGRSVSVDGPLAAVGAPLSDPRGNSSGSVFVFSTVTGEELVRILPQIGSPNDEFGHAVALKGEVVAVGARLDTTPTSNSGSVSVIHVLTGNVLFQIIPHDGEGADMFGCSVDMDEQYVVVGACGDDDMGSNAGAGYIYNASDGSFVRKLLAPDGQSGDGFGVSIAVADGTVVVGANGDDDPVSNSGSAYLFDIASGALIAKLTQPGGVTYDEFGRSVTIADGVVAVGAPYRDVTFGNRGCVYLFDAGTGALLTRLVDENGSFDHYFGFAVALDGHNLAVGASGANGGRGAAYVLTPDVNDNDGNGVPDTCPCPPDLNQDEELNFFDVQMFLNLYSQQDDRADLNADNQWDFFDVQRYLSLFSAGCP